MEETMQSKRVSKSEMGGLVMQDTRVRGYVEHSAHTNGSVIYLERFIKAYLKKNQLDKSTETFTWTALEQAPEGLTESETFEDRKVGLESLLSQSAKPRGPSGLDFSQSTFEEVLKAMGSHKFRFNDTMSVALTAVTELLIKELAKGTVGVTMESKLASLHADHLLEALGRQGNPLFCLVQDGSLLEQWRSVDWKSLSSEDKSHRLAEFRVRVKSLEHFVQMTAKHYLQDERREEPLEETKEGDEEGKKKSTFKLREEFKLLLSLLVVDFLDRVSKLIPVLLMHTGRTTVDHNLIVKTYRTIFTVYGESVPEELTDFVSSTVSSFQEKNKTKREAKKTQSEGQQSEEQSVTQTEQKVEVKTVKTEKKKSAEKPKKKSKKKSEKSG